MPILAPPTDGLLTLTEINAYLDQGEDPSWGEDDIVSVLAAEAADQANRCRFPANAEGVRYYPEPLREALLRRIAHNLAVRAVPLGVQATLTEIGTATTYVGGTDAEVKRLEAPYRRKTVG